jgi:putative SOS response-associated peptidase YedK
MDELFGTELLPVGIDIERLEMEPQEEIAPGSVQPVVWIDPAGRRRLDAMRWGFQLPGRFLFNTRSEEASTARFWQESFRLRRCLIPADGFYEWARLNGNTKNKFTFTVDGGALVGLAGVWQPWLNPKTGVEEQTFSILTGAARELMASYHDRQPAMIAPADFASFLAPATAEPARLLQFHAGDRMQAAASPPEKKNRANSAQGLLFALDNTEDETCQ